jgi:hypothetical protein
MDVLICLETVVIAHLSAAIIGSADRHPCQPYVWTSDHPLTHDPLYGNIGNEQW